MSAAKASKSRLPQHPRAGAPLAVYTLARGKAIAMLLLATTMCGFGLWWLLSGGTGNSTDDLIGGLVFTGLGGFLAHDMQRALRLRGPALTVDQAGVHDSRRGEVYGWDEIRSAEIKRLILARSLRLYLEDGRRVDVDLTLLSGVRPKELMDAIHRAAPAVPDGETADR